MKCRYMVEATLDADPDGTPFYRPIGVWVEGPGPGLHLVIKFLPGNEAARAVTDPILPRMHAAGMRGIPEGFLEYWQETMSPYVGMRGAIRTTDRFPSAHACATKVLSDIRAGREV